MPQKNVAKQYEAGTSYHVYNRTVGGFKVFITNKNCELFVKILKRYLDKEVHKDSQGHIYPKLSHKVSLEAFCLMPNHFHLLIHNIEMDGVTDLLRRLLTSFSKTINYLNGRSGTLFETTFKAAPIDSESYLMHISRYIHLNPLDVGQSHTDYRWSSYQHYAGARKTDWLRNEKIIGLFSSNHEYSEFVKQGIDQHVNRK